MRQNITAGLQAWLASNNVAWRADVITITLSDGTTQYFYTTAEGNIFYNGHTFLSPAGGGPLVSRQGYNQGCRMVIDTMDLTLTGGLLYTIGGLTLQLLAAQGYFDGARLRIDHIIGSDPNSAIAGTSGGVINSMFEGRVARVEPQAGSVILRCKSELVTLNQPIPRFLIMHQCGNAVYDAHCSLNKATFTVVGAVDGSPTASIFHTSSAAVTAHGAGYYNLGVLKFTSGVNNGLTQAVQSWNGSTFTMQLPFPAAPAAADTFAVYPGCDKAKGTCLTRFNNLPHYRGFSHTPSPETGTWYA